MRGRGRMDHQAARITHVGQMGEELQTLDQLLALLARIRGRGR